MMIDLLVKISEYARFRCIGSVTVSAFYGRFNNKKIQENLCLAAFSAIVTSEAELSLRKQFHQ